MDSVSFIEVLGKWGSFYFTPHPQILVSAILTAFQKVAWLNLWLFEVSYDKGVSIVQMHLSSELGAEHFKGHCHTVCECWSMAGSLCELRARTNVAVTFFHFHIGFYGYLWCDFHLWHVFSLQLIPFLGFHCILAWSNPFNAQIPTCGMSPVYGWFFSGTPHFFIPTYFCNFPPSLLCHPPTTAMHLLLFFFTPASQLCSCLKRAAEWGPEMEKVMVAELLPLYFIPISSFWPAG